MEHITIGEFKKNAQKRILSALQTSRSQSLWLWMKAGRLSLSMGMSTGV